MIIMNANRFGLSQLHQLRGRVGRGATDAHCFLIAEAKSQTAKQRINAMLKTSDGFKLAEHDLKIRGPGDVLGTRQSGELSLNLANLVTDEKVLLNARDAVIKILDEDPTLSQPKHHALKTNPLAQTGMMLSTEQLN